MAADRRAPVLRAKVPFFAAKLQGHFAGVVHDEDVDDPVRQLVFVHLVDIGRADNLVFVVYNIDFFHKITSISRPSLTAGAGLETMNDM